MSDEFMRTRAGNSRKQEIPYSMFQNGAVPDFEDMADVCLIAARAWTCERKVADTPSHLDQVFASNLRVGLPGDAVIRKKEVDLLIVDDLPAHHVDGRLANDLDVLGGIRIGHDFFLECIFTHVIRSGDVVQRDKPRSVSNDTDRDGFA